MNPVKWFKKKNEDQSLKMYAPIELYITRIYSEEREFLKNVIQKFVELVEKELPDDYDNTMPGSLGLIEFDFKSDDVQAWTSLYNAIKNKGKIIWPKLQPVCNFPYSNDPENLTKYGNQEVQVSEDFKTENKYVYNKFEKFKTKYDDWVKSTSDNTEWKQNEVGLRIWFHARAWLAFHKAIQSNLIKQEDRDDYIKKNRIQREENKYLVLGSTMALVLPAASLPAELLGLVRVFVDERTTCFACRAHVPSFIIFYDHHHLNKLCVPRCIREPAILEVCARGSRLRLRSCCARAPNPTSSLCTASRATRGSSARRRRKRARRARRARAPSTTRTRAARWTACASPASRTRRRRAKCARTPSSRAASRTARARRATPTRRPRRRARHCAVPVPRGLLLRARRRRLEELPGVRGGHVQGGAGRTAARSSQSLKNVLRTRRRSWRTRSDRRPCATLGA
jgi:hypothetical protein